jgi:hypothetical protein
VSNARSYCPVLRYDPSADSVEETNVYSSNRGRKTTGQGRQGSIIQRGCKVQDSRRAHGQVSQRSVIQSSGAKVQDDRQAQGQGSQNGQNRETGKQEQGNRWQQGNKTLVGSMNKTNYQQTNKEHRYKYTGDNGEDG